MSRFNFGGILPPAILAVGLMQLLDPLNAHAQTAQYFQFPSWGGYVSHGFDDTHDAHEGWYHTGLDIVLPRNQSTYALAAAYGVVDSITKNGVNDHDMGNCVVIRHKVIVSSRGATATYYTLYAHLAATNVSVGQSVSGGQIIGITGGSGGGQPNHWPVHLHFEVKTSGVIGAPSKPTSYWGYTPQPAENYGYIDPAVVIGKWIAVK